MANKKAEKASKSKLKNPGKAKTKFMKKIKRKKNQDDGNNKHIQNDENKCSKSSRKFVHSATASQQLSYFLDQFQLATGLQLSSLELESIKDTCILELSEDLVQDVSNLGKHIKAAFGTSWKEMLYEGRLVEGIDPGSPAVLIFSTSALRSLELLRGLRSLTGECHAAKLFSKHLKVEDQVCLLKNRVNIASGTPSRMKKLIDMEALGLSRVHLIVLDMQTDVKGYSLLTLPQVRDEFWDLYKCYFHPRLLQGNLRICLYSSLPISLDVKKAKRKASD